jgi:hypothetical protein
MNRVALGFVSVFLVSSCHVRNQLYNPQTVAKRSIVAVELNGDENRRRTDRVDAACDPAAQPCVAFLEFDEMGELWDPEQLKVALQLIEKAKSESANPIIATFVHGWKNNAKDDRPGRQNGNVVGFEGVLEYLKRQGKYRNFPIVGIYISWRGDLINKYWPAGRTLSYFNRERAVIRIPGAGMTGALTQIMVKARRGREGALVVMVGHSFGGLILERALTQAMTDFVLRRGSGAGAWADLVVFVNSAAAASEGKQMLDLLKGLDYGAAAGNQRPLFLSISSLGDAATRFAVPIGHGPSFLGLGASGSWRTYPNASPAPPVASQSSYYLSTTAHLEALQSHLIVDANDPNDVKRRLDASGKAAYFREAIEVKPGSLRYGICEKPGRWNDTPYWAMQMPATIVRDHSGIFNTRFLSLLEAFLLDEREMTTTSLRPVLRLQKGK